MPNEECVMNKPDWIVGLGSASALIGLEMRGKK
jgi:hypothetical protein